MRVFFSYHSRDIEAAQRLDSSLRQQMPQLDVYLAPRSLTAGAYWLPQIADEVTRADAMVFLVGQRIGPWQELEYYEALRLSRLAERQGRPVIVPVIMAEQAPGLPFFDLLHRIFAPDPTQPDTLAAVAASLTGAAPAGMEPAWKQFNPYKGLPALSSADAAFFFGRDDVTAETLDALRSTPDRVIVLIGASGVGKSSVAQAGVLAALKSQRWPGEQNDSWPAELADSRAWLQLAIRLGESPLKELALGFVSLVVERSYEQDRDAEGWVARFKEGARLADLLRVVRRELDERTGSDALRRFVLYVDQGEELYSRASPVDAQRASALLAEAAGQPDVHILASLRADYYGHLQADTALFPVTRRIDVPPLRADRLEEIIRRPAERLGARFDSPDMPTQIAAATADEAGALPLLSYLMSDMWAAMQARSDGLLRWSERPELIDIAAPLRERAERYRISQPAREAALRRLFTLRLTHLPREGEPVRRRARKDECKTDEWQIAETLAEPAWRLLTLSAPDTGREPIAEVAHEQLLRKWPTLTRWLEEQREFLVWKGEIESDRREWEALPPADRASGLLSGRRLRRAQHWLDSREDDVPAKDRDFVEQSVAAETEAKNKALRDQQRLQEAELQTALERAVSSKKIARRTVLGSLAVTAVGGVAGFQSIQAAKANLQARTATADLEAQLADLKRFFGGSGGKSLAPPGGDEETRPAPGGQMPNLAAARPTWGVTAVGATRSRSTGRGCVVALLGTGIDASHPAFRGVTLIQKDFTGTGNGDSNGFTTHTAGTIFGWPVESQRFGVAPGVSEALIAKVMNQDGIGSKEGILAALLWVSGHPRQPDVICAPLDTRYAELMSSSLEQARLEQGAGTGAELTTEVAKGLREYLQELRAYQSFSVVAASLGKGAVLIMPAGNNSTLNARVPVTSPMSVAQGVISVGAVDEGHDGFSVVVASYSNSHPTLCAPGSNVASAVPNGEIGMFSGTSMACAHAAGVAALWWEYLRNKNPGTRVTSRMVMDEMLKAVRADAFAPGVQEVDRGAGLIQAPPA